jgi:hypothetical protein
VILPTGNASKGLGNGGPGWQVNLPFSRQFGDAYLHWNTGLTHTPSAKVDDGRYNLLTPHVAMSGIWQVRPMLNLMLESVLEWEETVDAGLGRRERIFVLAPGLRTGWNLNDAQAIVGVAMPASFANGTTRLGVFGYFSYELPFSRQP